MPLETTFFVTLMYCDLNMYSCILYKPLQGCDYSNFFFYKTTLLC